jgi:nucleoside-diphosphate-sugar epimerase
MRIVVTGATGNVGTSVLEALGRDPGVESILGLARRRPQLRYPKVEWAQADVSRDDLVPHLRGADAVIHLAWLIQPGRDEAATRAANVEGSRRTFEATVAAEVPALVYASSVGAYSPGPKDRAVDESWPTEGIETSFYSRHKAEVERILDGIERNAPRLRSVRLRPGLIFKREAATGIRRLFAGPFLPSPLLNPGLLPVVPSLPNLVFQAVHSHDVGEASRLAATSDEARGPYNVAAEPVLDPDVVATALGARTVPIPARVARGLAAATFRLRLQPTEPGWLDMALAVPIMDTARARSDLGWAPAHTATDTLLELLEGISGGAGIATPPLDPSTSGPLRVRELLTGLGQRSI